MNRLVALLLLSLSLAAPSRASVFTAPSARRLVYTNTTIPTGNTVSATNAEAFFASQATLAAGPAVGTTYFITVAGTYTTGLAGTTTIRVYWGSTLLLSTPSLSLLSVAGQTWTGTIKVKVLTTGTTGTVQAMGQFVFVTTLGAATMTAISSTAAITVNTAAAPVIRVSAQAGALTSSYTLADFTIEQATASSTN